MIIIEDMAVEIDAMTAIENMVGKNDMTMIDVMTLTRGMIITNVMTMMGDMIVRDTIPIDIIIGNETIGIAIK